MPLTCAHVSTMVTSGLISGLYALQCHARMVVGAGAQSVMIALANGISSPWDQFCVMARRRSGEASAPFYASGGARPPSDSAALTGLCNRQWAIGEEISSESARPCSGAKDASPDHENEPGNTMCRSGRAILLSALLQISHARNCLTVLFLWFYGCQRSSHPPRHARTVQQGRGLSPDAFPLCQLCYRRCKQYTPVHRPLRIFAYNAATRRNGGARIFRSRIKLNYRVWSYLPDRCTRHPISVRRRDAIGPEL